MWTYEVPTGKLYRPDGSVIAVGYSGGWGGELQYRNNPDAENIPDEGPIPEGMWTIGELYHDVVIKCADVMRLTPDLDTDLQGRIAEVAGVQQFMMHGDSLEHPGAASKGCIVMPLFARLAVGNSSDKRLDVVRKTSFPLPAAA
jgi:hypothetical protein